MYSLLPFYTLFFSLALFSSFPSPSSLTLYSIVVVEAADSKAPHPHRGILPPYKVEKPTLKLTEAEKKLLSSGKPVLKQESVSTGKASEGKAYCIQDIRANPKIVWNKIIDLPNYPKMVKEVTEVTTYATTHSTIDKRMNRLLPYETKDRMKLGLGFGLSLEYFIHHRINPQKKLVTWTLDYDKKSDLDDSVGYWYVQENSNVDKLTRVYYSVHVKVPEWLPSFAVDMLKTKALKSATAWVKVEAENEQTKATQRLAMDSKPASSQPTTTKTSTERDPKPNPFRKFGDFVGATGKKLNNFRKKTGEKIHNVGKKVKNAMNVKKHLENHKKKKEEQVKAKEEQKKLDDARETFDSFIWMSLLAGITFFIFSIIYGRETKKTSSEKKDSQEK